MGGTRTDHDHSGSKAEDASANAAKDEDEEEGSSHFRNWDSARLPDCQLRLLNFSQQSFLPHGVFASRSGQVNALTKGSNGEKVYEK